jgi:hypothetical protein
MITFPLFFSFSDLVQVKLLITNHRFELFKEEEHSQKQESFQRFPQERTKFIG